MALSGGPVLKSSSEPVEPSLSSKQASKQVLKSESMPLTPHKASTDLSNTTFAPTQGHSLPSSHLPPTPDATPQPCSSSLKRPRPSDIDNSPSAGRSSKRLAAEPTANPSTKAPAPATSPTTITPSSRCYLFPPSTSSTPTATTTPTSKSKPRTKLSLFRKPDLSKPKPLPSVSGIELKRAAESVLRQVDWNQVAEYVASNRKGKVFKTVVRGMLQERVDGLFESEAQLEGEEQQGDGDG